jgi:hypothetical protein
MALSGKLLLRKPRLYQSCSAEEEKQEQQEEQHEEEQEKAEKE